MPPKNSVMRSSRQSSTSENQGQIDENGRIPSSRTPLRFEAPLRSNRSSQRRLTSSIWSHCQREDNGTSVKVTCLICNRIWFLMNSSTTQIRRHLMESHKIQLDQRSPNITVSQLEILIAKAASINLMSYRSIAETEMIRISLKSLFSEPPTRQQISNVIKKVFDQKQEEMAIYISHQNLVNCTLSIDGVQIQGRNFINLFIYEPTNNEVLYLGCVRQKLTSTSKNIKNLIQQSILGFGINAQRIKYLVTDSASNMLSTAKQFNWISQRCLVHMCHNIVKKYVELQKLVLKVEDDFQYDESYSESDSEDTSSIESFNEQNKTNSSQCLLDIIRNFVRQTKKSKNKRKELKALGGESINFLLDCPTRWESCFEMIKRFLQHIQIANMLLQRWGNKRLSELDTFKLQKFSRILQQISCASKKIQVSSSNILKAEQVFDALVYSLKEIGEEANKLAELVINYYEKYRNKQLICCGLYLGNKQNYREYRKRSFFGTIEVNEIQDYILQKFCNQAREPQESQSFQEVYRRMYKSENGFLKQEILQYSMSGFKNKRLNQILLSIKGVPCSTCQNQRDFSSLSRILTKHRGKLSDSSINSLMFLRRVLKENN